MKKLLPNVDGKEVEYLNKRHVFVKVMDHGEVFMLREIIIGPGQHTWYWISFKESKSIDISPHEYDLTTFDDAINKSVCDPYCSVYMLSSYFDLWKHWPDLRYDDKPPTIYKSIETEENG